MVRVRSAVRFRVMAYINKLTMLNHQETQIKAIIEIFEIASRENKLIFLKGGWNIDLSYGQITREHEDIDFHFEKKDYDFLERLVYIYGF